MPSPEIPNAELDADTEGFQLEVNEVAELLGVTRTRVSQLTSAGQLSFERRRVGTRNRLFYKRSEVLAHQRGFYGRQSASAHQHFFSKSIDASSNAFIEERFGATAQSRPADSLSGVEHLSSTILLRLEEQNLHNRRQLAKIVELVSNSLSKGQSAASGLLSADSLRSEEQSLALTQSLIHEVCQLAEQLSSQQTLLLDVIESSRSIKKDLHQILQQQSKPEKAAALEHLPVRTDVQQVVVRSCKSKPVLRRSRTVSKRKIFKR